MPASTIWAPDKFSCGDLNKITHSTCLKNITGKTVKRKNFLSS